MDTLYIDQETGKLVNIHAPFKGRSRLDSPELREAVGVIEIERDAPPDEYNDHPDWYEVREDWEAIQRPYVIYTRKSDEQINEITNNKIKAQIAALEAGQHRAIREATLTGDKTRLQKLDDDIAALRSQLK